MGNNDKLLDYERLDKFNPEKIQKLAGHYAEILRLIGEDPERDV